MTLPAIEGPVTLAVDMSQWGGDFTLTEARAAMAQGYSMCIPAAGPGGYGKMYRQQADDALRAGMSLGAYIFLEWGNDPRQWVAAALNSVGEYRDQIGYWALDLEDNINTPPPTLQERIDYAWAALDQLQEFGVAKSQLIIYTGGWYWVRGDAFQNTDYFAKQGYGLWESYYDENKNRNGWAGCPWPIEKIYITQYGGTQDVGGQSVDVNAVYRMPNGDRSGTLGEDMAAIEELNKLKIALFAGSERDSQGWSDQQRLEYANYIIEAKGQSMLDLAASAISLSKDALAIASNGSDGSDGDSLSVAEFQAILAAAAAKAESFKP